MAWNEVQAAGDQVCLLAVLQRCPSEPATAETIKESIESSSSRSRIAVRSKTKCAKHGCPCEGNDATAQGLVCLRLQLQEQRRVVKVDSIISTRFARANRGQAPGQSQKHEKWQFRPRVPALDAWHALTGVETGERAKTPRQVPQVGQWSPWERGRSVGSNCLFH